MTEEEARRSIIWQFCADAYEYRRHDDGVVRANCKHCGATGSNGAVTIKHGPGCPVATGEAQLRAIEGR